MLDCINLNYYIIIYLHASSLNYVLDVFPVLCSYYITLPL